MPRQHPEQVLAGVALQSSQAHAGGLDRFRVIRAVRQVVQAVDPPHGGKSLPIEQRMLRSIEKVCRLKSVAITNVQPKMGEWRGGLRNRTMAIRQGEIYDGQRGLPSHAIHGTWVNFVQHHFAVEEGGFRLDPT